MTTPSMAASSDPSSCAALGARFNRRGVLAGVAGAALTSACGAPPPVSLDGEPGRWREGVALPEPVQEIFAAGHNGRIHIAGGFIAEDGVTVDATARHLAFDPEAGAWRDRAALAGTRHHVHLASAGGVLYAIGGYDYQGARADWLMDNQVWSYLDEDDRWEPATPLPEPAGESVCVARGAMIHVIGGRRPSSEESRTWRDYRDDDKHWCFDSETGVWDRCAPARSRRNSAAGAVLDGRIHVIGGRYMRGGALAYHEVYEPEEDRWRWAAPMPAPRSGAAAAVLGGRLYVFGGEEVGPERAALASGVVYDAGADAWTSIAPLSAPRHGMGVVTLGEEIHLIGGALSPGGVDTTTRVEIFSRT